MFDILDSVQYIEHNPKQQLKSDIDYLVPTRATLPPYKPFLLRPASGK